MVLQSDVATPWMVAKCRVEFVRRAIGTFVRLGELSEIRTSHLLAIQRNLDATAIAGNLDVVPFPNGFHGVTRGRHEIVKRARIMEPSARRVVTVHPAVGCPAVEQQNPAVTLFSRRQSVVNGEAKSGNERSRQ